MVMQEQLADGGGEDDDTMLWLRNSGPEVFKQTWWGPHEFLAATKVQQGPAEAEAVPVNCCISSTKEELSATFVPHENKKL